MVVGVIVVIAISFHQQNFVNIVAIDKQPLEVIRAVIFAQHLPVVVVVVKRRCAGDG